jgi:integrase/recombinase XerD
LPLQRIVLPSGKITGSAYDGDAIVREIRNFIIYLEVRHAVGSPAVETVANITLGRIGDFITGFW